MQRICGKCKLEIVPGEMAMVCEGFCEDINRFHLECVGSTAEYADACQHRNILWMCDSCRDLMENIKFRNTVNKLQRDTEPQRARDSELDQLKQEICRINTSLVELSDIVKSGNSSQLPIAANNVHGNFLSSTMAQRHNESSERPTDDENYFELFLSNIAPDVTDEDVDTLVREKLLLSEPIYVKRLVPAWRNTATLDYISFKVKLKRKHRIDALDCTVWPTGIKCREFKNHSTSAWRPDR